MLNSVNDDQHKLDQSEKLAMEDPTAATIDLLRGQLLSERAISRTARQRADELAKRVVELEEQLKLVNVQRKKAEKATSEVLAILENHGISDFSEVYDSESDRDGVGGEYKEVDDRRKEDINLTTSSSMQIKAENLPGSELGDFPVVGRSLSWRSRGDSPNSHENTKCLDETRRFKGSAIAVGSPTKHSLGKSNRQFKKMELRSSKAEISDEPPLAARSEDASHCTTNIPKRKKCEKEEESFGNSVQDSLEYRRKDSNTFLLNGSETNTEMQREVEHKARLADHFEEEENDQREWEEKFKGSPDSCERGNDSDITEERDDIRADTSQPVNTIPSLGQERKSEMEQVVDNEEAMAKDLHNRLLSQPSNGNAYAHEQSQNTGPGFSFPLQDDLGVKSNEKMKPEWSENNSFYSASHQSSEHQSTQFSSFHEGSSNNKESFRNAFPEVKHHEISNGLGGVLDALQRAKLSLKHKLNSQALPSSYGPMTRKTVSFASVGDPTDMPVGCAGLFRVPTSSEFEAHGKANLLTYNPDSESSSRGRYHPQLTIGDGADDKYSSRPYLGGSSVNNTHRAVTDPSLDIHGMGLQTSSRYMYPSYVDMMPRLPSDNGSSRTSRSMAAAEDRYLEYNDSRRLDLYRR